MQETTKPSPPQSIVLCLSGGGLRATFFHLGVIRGLKRLGSLDKVTDIVSVSGGSIIAAHLIQHWGRYVGDPDSFDGAQLGLLSLRRWDLRGRAIRRSLLWWPIYIISLRFPKYFGRLRIGRTELLRREYDKFFENINLYELSKINKIGPSLHLVSTNLKTGGLCTFSGTRYHVFERAGSRPYNAELTKISLAVVASSAFPPVFPPVLFDESMTSESPGAFRVSPHVLTDGGVYDNTGFESAALLVAERQRSDVKLSDLILVSDAGSPFQWRQVGEFTNPVSLALRTAEIIMNRVAEETLRRIASNDRVGLISIDGVEEHGPLSPMIQKYISRIRTDLDRFSDIEVAALVGHGENKTINQLAPRFGIELRSGVINDFPIELPVSGKTIARALERSWKIRWWNTFTNFSDIVPTMIINTTITFFFVTILFITYLIVGKIYLTIITPLRSPLPPLVIKSNSVEQGDPIIKALPSSNTSTPPGIGVQPAVNRARLDHCLDLIDTKLSVDEVQRLARRCLQPNQQ